MKSIYSLCFVVLLPVAALAQTTPPPDNSNKPKPTVPVLAKDHAGWGRVGIRLTFDKVTGIPTIAGLTKGGPASDFGFKVGDVIIKIDKNYTSTLTEDEVKLALHGQPGTGVELTVQRGDNPLFIVRAIERRVLLPAEMYAEDTLDSAPPQPEEKP